jgi:hypothetical protein
VLKEGRALARVQSPYLARCFSAERDGDRVYLVMEYVPGRTLAAMLQDRALGVGKAVRLVEHVAEGLKAVHACGLLHRDLKPSNILIGDDGLPRLIDFGLAAPLASNELHAVSGTLSYMAPEQARGQGERVDARVDVFGLGAVLYELITGKAPFGAASWRESWDRACRCDFDRTALDGVKISQDLRRICLKAMAADPAERYASAEELQKALARFVAGPKMLSVAARVGGFVLLGGLAYALVRTALNDNHRPGPHIVVPQPVPVALVGEMTLRVWSPEKDGKRGWKIGVETPQSLPVRQGEMIHIEAKLNQPACVYLLWLDGQGKITPLYPWIDQDFAKLPAEVQAVSELHDPPQRDKGWPVVGPSGLETILMLARRTPLPPDIDLAAEIGTLPPAPLRDPHEIAVRGFDIGQPTDAIDQGSNRGPAKKARQIDEPLLRLVEKLRPHFDFTRAVRFAYQGQ